MFLAAAIVLLAAFVLVDGVYSNSINQANIAMAESQQEASKIKSILDVVSTDKAKLAKEVQLKEKKISQLRQENASLK